MLAQTLVVNINAEAGNLMEITVFDEKTVAQGTEFPAQNHLYKCNHGTLSLTSMNNCLYTDLSS